MKAVPASRYWCFAILAGGALAWDLISKWWVFDELGAPNRSSAWSWETGFLWGRFQIRLSTVFNQGALFGIGQGLSWLFALLSLVVAGGIVYWLFARGAAGSWWLTLTLSLILAGALGNLYDRLHLHGWTTPEGKPQYGVRDFLDCKIPWISFERPLRPKLVREKDWPVFNFADVYLVTGAIMLTLYSFFAPQHNEPVAVEAKPPDGSQTKPGGVP